MIPFQQVASVHIMDWFHKKKNTHNNKDYVKHITSVFLDNITTAIHCSA